MQASTFHLLTIFPLAIGIAILLAAAIHDVAARTVPNWMALALALAGLLARIADGTILPALLAGPAVFLAAAFCWRRGWMGGGDVKLLGAVATLVPPHAVFTLLAFIAFAGGGLAMLYLVGRAVAGKRKPVATHRPAALAARVLRAEVWRIRRGGPLPYACAIAAGLLITLLRTGA
ncbi:MAG TPA: A24 family peptidase [Rhodopila sp.]|nr:A24 family peptidase [Rhodopila sp.]